MRVNASRSAGGGACTDARGADVAVKTFSGIGFKVPCPPDHPAFSVTNHKAEVTALVVFEGDIAVRGSDRLRLSPGERPRWQ